MLSLLIEVEMGMKSSAMFGYVRRKDIHPDKRQFENIVSVMAVQHTHEIKAQCVYSVGKWQLINARLS